MENSVQSKLKSLFNLLNTYILKNLLITLIFSMPVLLIGQNFSVKGQVFDYASGVFIADATIDISQNGKSLFILYSDTQGKFKKELSAGDYTISISKDKYTAVVYNITLDQNKDLAPIFLEDNTVNLDAVIIETKKKNVSINIEGVTLKIDESAFFDGINLPEALNIMPGVSLTADNSISVLGKSKILVLVNGRETNLNIADLPAKNVEKIVIDSNPSAKYDAKYNVVLKVTLKKWLSQGFSGGVNSTATINKRFSHNNNTYLNYNKNKLNISSYFAIDKNETFTQDNGFQRFNNILQENYSETDAKRLSKYAYVNVNYDLNDTDKFGVELDYLDANSDSETDANVLFEQNNLNAVIDSSFVSESRGAWEGSNYSLGGFYTRNRDSYTFDTSIKYFNNKNDNTRRFVNERSDAASAPFNQFTISNSNTSSLITTADYEKTLKKGHAIEAGMRFTNFKGDFTLDIDLNSADLSNVLFDFDENIFASYFNWSKSFEQFSLRAGVRTEYFNRDVVTDRVNNFNANNLDVFPSFSIDHTPSNNHYFKFSYNKKIRRPGFSEITPFEYITSYNTKFVGNPNLKNEISHNVELTYYLKQKYYFIFYMNYNRNLIESTEVIDDFISINSPINYDYYSFGLQTGFTQKITSWLTSIQKFTINKVVSDGVLLNNDFRTNSWESHLYFAEIINLKKKGNIILVGNYYTPNFYDIYKVRQGFKLDTKYSLKMLENKLTASVTFRDVLGTYYNRISSSYINQSSFYDKDNNVRSVVFALSYVFDKGRKKDIKTGTDIKEEKERLKQ